MGFFNVPPLTPRYVPRLGSSELKLEGIKEELFFHSCEFLVGRQCDTMTVSGVTHRSYFQRDLLISTVVTFGHPETGYYIAPLLIPTTLRLHLILNHISQTLFHQHEVAGFRDMGISQRSRQCPSEVLRPCQHTLRFMFIVPPQTLGFL